MILGLDGCLLAWGLMRGNGGGDRGVGGGVGVRQLGEGAPRKLFGTSVFHVRHSVSTSDSHAGPLRAAMRAGV